MTAQTNRQVSTAPAPTFDPLHRPTTGDDYAYPADSVLAWAREALAAHQNANMHDHTAMVVAATALYRQVQLLVNVVDAENAVCRPSEVDAWRKQVSA